VIAVGDSVALHLRISSRNHRSAHVAASSARANGDAHIAALCIEHEIDEILTADRDFSRFPLKVTNPFRS